MRQPAHRARSTPILFVFKFFMGFFVSSIMTISIGVILLAWNVIQNLADIVGYDKNSSFIKALTIYMAMACGMGEFCVPFKGWQLALCNAYTAAVGAPANYPLFIFSALLIGTTIIFLCVLAMKYIYKHEFSKLADFDAGVLASSQKGMTKVQGIYLGTFLFIMVITLVASVMPPEMAVVQIINKKFTTAGIYALIIAILCLVKMDGEPLMDFAKVSQVGVRWEPILICAAAIPIANALTSDATGILDLFASILNPLFANASIPVLISFILIVTLILTNLGSNTGVALFLIAITVPLGKQMGANMGLLGIVIIYKNIIFQPMAANQQRPYIGLLDTPCRGHEYNLRSFECQDAGRFRVIIVRADHNAYFAILCVENRVFPCPGKK